jgi:phytol kinase
VLLTILFWRDSSIGIVALMILCGGDGLADISSSLIGGRTIPWYSKKTNVGSLATFFGGLFLSLIIIWICVRMGYLHANISSYLLPVVLIAVVSAIVESLPFENIDNITVPLVSVLI